MTSQKACLRVLLLIFWPNWKLTESVVVFVYKIRLLYLMLQVKARMPKAKRPLTHLTFDKFSNLLERIVADPFSKLEGYIVNATGALDYTYCSENTSNSLKLTNYVHVCKMLRRNRQHLKPTAAEFQHVQRDVPSDPSVVRANKSNDASVNLEKVSENQSVPADESDN
ncbi:uncharacterized protein LOC128236907 [Mya arenaria]|uniref:uncharacterized protein LOC128236907 n=1 Tax=Mya arenaria TaxID=6604 RepID=UPI0022E6F5AD|nr:uncharacterized protein LOC128236907 [Mya arenaria]